MKDNKTIKILKNISEKENIKLFVVGGFVRDFLMNRESNDIDITSALKPEEIKKIFEKYGYNTFTYSEKHGTICVYIDDEIVEHTTFRKDSKCDGRHAEIEYSNNILDDASRRDFTINAFYYDIIENKIIDLFDGKKDIAEKRIRFILNPYIRLEEDHLRLIRAFRFAMRLNFKIDNNTYKIMNIFAKETGLKKVSPERILSEISKMLKYIDRDIFFDFLDCVNTNEIKDSFPIIKYLIDMKECRFYNHHHIRNNVLDHSLDVVMNLKKESNKFIGLFHDMFKINTIALNKRGEHSFIGHDKVNDFIDELNEFKSKSKITNNTFKRLKFFISTHMYIKNLKSRKSIFKFVFRFLMKNTSYLMFNEMKEIYIADDTSCTEDEDKRKEIINKFNNIFKEIDDIRFEIIDIDNKISKRFIAENISDKSKVKKVVHIVIKNSFFGNKEPRNESILGTIKSLNLNKKEIII